MQANRSRDTSPELAVRRELHKRGMRYRVCYPPLPGARRTVDVAFTAVGVAVLIDGCYWHGCPLHYREPRSNIAYWAVKIARNVARDGETTALLQAAGWTVLRFWEHEDAAQVADTIEAAVRSARVSRPSKLANELTE